MKWLIPAKTFLLGEYAALAGYPAFILTTVPSFELSLTPKIGLQGIHPLSPAGKWWSQHGDASKGLAWLDPYREQGGMGASSAQFLGAYLATATLKNQTVCSSDLLAAYKSCAWDGQGVSPSGYDVIAQSLGGCVYLSHHQYESYSWAFKDLGFMVLRTHHKLATHQHLRELQLPHELNHLAAIVASAKRSFDLNQSSELIDSVNRYHDALLAQNLVVDTSLNLIVQLKRHKDILAIKGCGAMGADLLLALIPIEKCAILKEELQQQGFTIVATHEDLCTKPSLIEALA